jgi:hypothetical protein
MDSKSLTEKPHPVGEAKNESFSHDKASAGASALPVDTGRRHYHVQKKDPPRFFEVRSVSSFLR